MEGTLLALCWHDEFVVRFVEVQQGARTMSRVGSVVEQAFSGECALEFVKEIGLVLA